MDTGLTPPSRNPWETWLNGEMEAWEQEGLLRTLSPLEPISSVHVGYRGRRWVLFSGNDYLGLSCHSEIRRAVADSVRSDGMGPRGSALVCGYTTLHARLESELAALKKTESALLFPTGYAANLAVLSSLAGPDTAIYSDALNHASLIDGCRMAKRRGAEVHIFPHRDVEELRRLMKLSRSRRKLIVTDSVFSMDGDLAPLPELVELKEEFGAWLFVDEAHGTLVYGDSGAGVCEAQGVSQRVEIQMGTLSKAFGSLGGYVACSERLKQWILNRGRTYIYSTALPLPCVTACLASLKVLREDDRIRCRLWEWVDLVANRLGKKLQSPIVPILVGGNEAVLERSRHLLDRGYHVPGIRPPTVPPGTARLRIALSAAHEKGDVEGLLTALGY